VVAEETALHGVETPAVPRAMEGGEQIYVASQWQLMWWRFRKHHLAMAAGIVVVCFYLVAIFADFLATTDPELSDARRSLMPPQRLHWFDDWSLQPHVYAVKGARDPKTFKRVYQVDPTQKIPVAFFARGFPYKLFGLIPTDRHLLGVGQGYEAAQTLFLLGTDVQGRDLWSRLLYATRISVSIGLVGVALSLFLGVLLGGVSGFYAGWVDTLIQRIIEIFRSIPTIPLWMGLAAALPRDWSILQIYFAITIIISLLGWTELARVVRGRFLALREEDFVVAARLAGCSQMRIIFVHMVPSFMSHIIAATTLALPAMIISETSLSFLGLGLRPPAVSWGVLLQQAQNVQTVAISPWLMLPAVPVIIAVLAFNFLGDGIRDAADPYGH
jgi:peptide/nickel transport system permease protein